jgi:hypothetical protein
MQFSQTFKMFNEGTIFKVVRQALFHWTDHLWFGTETQTCSLSISSCALSGGQGGGVWNV